MGGKTKIGAELSGLGFSSKLGIKYKSLSHANASPQVNNYYKLNGAEQILNPHNPNFGSSRTERIKG
jgi:hypothetical protein